jgi:hypothetical protein
MCGKKEGIPSENAGNQAMKNNLPPEILPRPDINSPALDTRRIRRLILRRSAESIGYRVSGNHLFSLEAFADIIEGKYRKSVIECPWAHPPKACRIAVLLSATYSGLSTQTNHGLLGHFYP